MAIADTRTWTDDLQDARERMREARKALDNWEAHLDALATDPQPGHAFAALRAGTITSNLVMDATGYGHEAFAGFMGERNACA